MEPEPRVVRGAWGEERGPGGREGCIGSCGGWAGGEVGAQGPVSPMIPSVWLRIAAVIGFLTAASVFLAAVLVFAASGPRTQGPRTQGPRRGGPRADITKNMI